MKALFLVALLAQSPTPAVELPRADAQVLVGWQSLRKDIPQDDYNDWLSDIFYAGAGAGWHWTDHLRTQIDFGAGTNGRHYRYQQLLVDGRPTYESSRLSVRQQSLAIAQQYQFFRNQWFHPRVGAGVELVHETSTEEFQPVILYDNAARTTVVIAPGRVDGPHDRYLARAFGETGFKAYVTPKAFFTGDMRIMFRGSIEEVLFRAGFGFDF